MPMESEARGSSNLRMLMRFKTKCSISISRCHNDNEFWSSFSDCSQ